MRSTFQITVLISAEFSFQRSTHFRSSHFRSSHFSRVLIFTEFSFSLRVLILSQSSHFNRVLILAVLISAEFSFPQSSHFSSSHFRRVLYFLSMCHNLTFLPQEFAKRYFLPYDGLRCRDSSSGFVSHHSSE